MLPVHARSHVALLDHTADLGLELGAPTLAGIYESAVLGLVDVLLDAATVRAAETREVEVDAPDPAALLVALLREVLYIYDVERWLPGSAEVRLADDRLSLVARLAGERFDPERHRVKTEVKAVTYHALTLERADGPDDGGWRATVVLDL